MDNISWLTLDCIHELYEIIHESSRIHYHVLDATIQLKQLYLVKHPKFENLALNLKTT